ncbi:hypothetical protein ACFL3R_00575 [Thermodesulfobacteriota bacterium]
MKIEGKTATRIEDVLDVELISEYDGVTLENLLLRISETNNQMLTTLKKIEYHLMLASDTELKDQDVGG